MKNDHDDLMSRLCAGWEQWPLKCWVELLHCRLSSKTMNLAEAIWSIYQAPIHIRKHLWKKTPFGRVIGWIQLIVAILDLFVLFLLAVLPVFYIYVCQ